MSHRFFVQMVEAANEGRLTGEVHLLVAGRHISGDLVSFETFAAGLVGGVQVHNDGRGDPLAPSQEMAKGHVHLKDAVEADGTNLGWFSCPVDQVTGFSVFVKKSVPISAKALTGTSARRRSP